LKKSSQKPPASRSSSSSQRGGPSKSSKRSYSAESLLSSEAMVLSMDPSAVGMDVDAAKSHHHFNKPAADFSWNLGVDQVHNPVLLLKL
jgi:hypothetical protein